MSNEKPRRRRGEGGVSWDEQRQCFVASATVGYSAAGKRIVRRAMARGYVERNVVELCDVPDGQASRPSKSLTLDQAVALLGAAEDGSLYAYVTVSLMVGARTEELRALQWDHVDLDGQPDRTEGIASTQERRRPGRCPSTTFSVSLRP